jgi:K(+)-stimulated pyrophosphate-energized sodium pump
MGVVCAREALPHPGICRGSKFVLTELAVVLSLDFVSLAFAGLLARRTLRRASSGPEGRRLINAATRASESFLFREAKLAAIATVAAILLVVGLHGFLIVRKVPVTTLPLAMWTALATLFGAGLAAAIAYLTTQMGLRATLRAVRASNLSLGQGAAVVLQGAGVAALSAEALGAATVTGLFGLLYLLGGGGALTNPEQAVPLLERAAMVLPGLGLGSIAGAAVFGLGGSAYHVCSELGGLSAFGLDASDPRNPSMVADLVGDHVGLAARRAVDMFAATTLASVATVLLGVAAFRNTAALSGNRAWALVTLPLVVRGTGVVASAFGLMTARTSESERPAVALWRGQTTVAVLVLGGLAGAAFWLLGPAHFGWFVAAGAGGVLSAVLVGHSSRRHVDRRLRPVQDVLDAARAGGAVTIARGLATGLGGAVLPVVFLAASLAAAFQLGERSGLGGGGLLATATALSSFLAASGYMLSLGLFGPIATGAVTVAMLDPDERRPDVRRRTALLEDAGHEGGAVAQAFFITLGCAAALLAGLGIPSIASASKGVAELAIGKPPVVWSGVLGATLIVAVAGRVVAAVARGARGVVLEAERQLRTFPKEGGVAQVPEGYTPSYRTLIELTARVAPEGLLVPTLVALIAPLALGIGLRLLYTSPGLAAEGLTSFVVIAAATGLGAALATDGSGAVLGAAHRASRPRGSSQGFEASLAGHALGSFIGDAAGPAAHLFVKATAAAALIVAPLLSAT